LKFLKAFGAFWYDFIIGDDWKIAAAVVLALGTLVVVMDATSLGDHGLAVLGAFLILGTFALSLTIDTTRGKR